MLHLADRDERTRAESLERLRSDQDQTLQYLIEVLQTNPGLRWKALCALRCLDISLAAALPVVTPHLHDDNRLCRLEAAELIVKMGPDARAAIPELIKLLEEKDEAISTLALAGIARLGLGPSDTDAIDPIAARLRKHLCRNETPSREVVGTTIELLRSIGPDVVPSLIACLRKAVPPASLNSAESRWSSFDEDYESWHFEPVFKVLEELLPQAQGAGARLLKLLAAARAPRDFRKDLLLLLGHVGPADANLVAHALIDFRTDDAYEELFPAVFDAFHRLGLPAIPVLIEILNDHDETRSVFAAQVLGGFNDDDYPHSVDDSVKQAARSSLPALIAAFQAGGSELKQACAYAMGTMRSAAKDAIPCLTEALESPSRHVQEAARQALHLIRLPD